MRRSRDDEDNADKGSESPPSTLSQSGEKEDNRNIKNEVLSGHTVVALIKS